MKNKRRKFWVLLLLLMLPVSVRAANFRGSSKPDTQDMQLYFGQLHAHTQTSDGTGTVAEAFAQASEVEGLDFFAVTDHSDSFDNDRQGSLTGDGGAVSREWAAGMAAAQAVTSGDFVGLYGFEMSWNQGQGHMSTFNTSGWLSRDQEEYKKYKDGLEHYYEALLTAPASVSQFNHPGTAYGDFKNFAWYSREVDDRVTLIEVGSGMDGEYRRYDDAYIRALDRGWHLAPTNNQNNHNGAFGSGNAHRTVVLASELTAEGIYDAMRHYRVYATEDSDLELFYTLNGYGMGSQLSAAATGETAHIVLTMQDPTDAGWGTVEVVTEQGAVAASAPAAARVTFELPTDVAWYFLRITQADGDVAITAPIWLRQKDDYGISALETETPLTRAGETQNILLKMENNAASPLSVSSVKLRDQEGNLLGSGDAYEIDPGEIREYSFPVCFAQDGVYTLQAEVSAAFDGESVILTKDLEITVLPPEITGDVLVVGGADAYAAFTALAAAQNVSVRAETGPVTPKQLEVCQLLVIAGTETEIPDEVVNYVNRGGNLLLLGTADGVAVCNKFLQKIGSTMSLNGDFSREAVYTASIAKEKWTEGIREGQIYGHIGGTVNPGSGSWLVKDSAGKVLLAAEGNVMLAGGDLLGDKWLESSDDPWAIPYANRTLAENLLGITRTEAKISSIAQVRSGTPGRIYLVEGTVTAGTHNPNTTFADTVYIQDATGGIAAVGYSEKGLEPGRRVLIVGKLEMDGENPEIRVQSMEILEKTDPIVPELVESALDASHCGKLLALEGTVISGEVTGESVSAFVLEDAQGNRTAIRVKTEIKSGSLGRNLLARIVQPGNRVRAVGICCRMDGEPGLLVRDCDEVELLWSPPEETVPPTTQPVRPTETEPPVSDRPTSPTTAPATEETTVPVTEPAAETTTVPVTEKPTIPATEPAVEPTTVPVTEKPTIPATEPAVEPTTVPATEPAVEPTTVPVTEAPTIPTTEPAVEPTTVPAAEEPTAPATEPAVEPSTAPVTEEPVTEPTTVPDSTSSSKKPTKPSGEKTEQHQSASVITNGNPPTGDLSYPGWAWGGIVVGIGILIRCLLLLI